MERAFCRRDNARKSPSRQNGSRDACLSYGQRVTKGYHLGRLVAEAAIQPCRGGAASRASTSDATSSPSLRTRARPRAGAVGPAEARPRAIGQTQGSLRATSDNASGRKHRPAWGSRGGPGHQSRRRPERPRAWAGAVTAPAGWPGRQAGSRRRPEAAPWLIRCAPATSRWAPRRSSLRCSAGRAALARSLAGADRAGRPRWCARSVTARVWRGPAGQAEGAPRLRRGLGGWKARGAVERRARLM